MQVYVVIENSMDGGDRIEAVYGAIDKAVKRIEACRLLFGGEYAYRVETHYVVYVDEEDDDDDVN